jgi:eukaryotic-like serine/threonine-protein kinase
MSARGEEAQGERQFGPYRLAQLLATGGMAEIHLAKTRGIEGFEKYVALKMIHPNFSSDEHFIQMLIDEAKISVQLQHVNIAHTFDLGRVGDTYYIAMEFVDGSDLFRILRRASEQDRYMPLETAVYIAKEVASGLDYAHRKRDAAGRSMGIVHRDVSPQNVLISHAGEVKIVDFGIAKATMRAKQTAVGVIKGKYYYMSPEQAWGDPLDHRTDIFSAGILLYEMLTGQMLYLEEDMTKLLEMVRRADIPPPSSKRREIPRELDRIVMRALAKKPDLRWQTAQDYATELERFLHAYAPDYTASRLATFVGEVMGPRAPAEPPPAARPPRAPAPPPPPTGAEGPRVTRGIERRSIVLSRSEFNDENSVIFNAAAGAMPGKPPRVSSSRDRLTTPHSLPPSARPLPQNRLTTPTGPAPAGRSSPPPTPRAADRATLPPVRPLAARLSAASARQPAGADPPTLDLGDDELVQLEPDAAEASRPGEGEGRAARPSGEDTADVREDPATHEPPADEDPTVIDVAGLAGRAREGTTRPMGAIQAEPPARPARSTPPAAPAARVSGPQPTLAAPETSGSSLPLVAPVEREEPEEPGRDGRSAARSVWPPRRPDAGLEDDGDDFFGLKIRGGLSRKQLLLGVFALAGVLGLGALGVAIFSPGQPRAFANVDVISIPPRARVLVDGEELGVTPLRLEQVATGRDFTLRVELPQHEPWERTERLTDTRHVKVVASLRPILGTLHVESTPVGAEVFVNNRSVGLTPLSRSDLSPFVDGTVEVRKQGYRPSRQPLEWKGGREVSLKLELAPGRD